MAFRSVPVHFDPCCWGITYKSCNKSFMEKFKGPENPAQASNKGHEQGLDLYFNSQSLSFNVLGTSGHEVDLSLPHVVCCRVRGHAVNVCAKATGDWMWMTFAFLSVGGMEW